MKTKHIIFIHGWATGPYVWLYQVSYFKDKGSVHTPELIGYGKKRLPASAAGTAKSELAIFDYMAKDISEFIVGKKLDNVCLVGWSMGGMVSLKVTSDLKDKVSRLILIGTTARFVRSAGFKWAVSRQIVEKIYNRMETDFDATLKWFYKFCFSSHERSRNEFGEVLKLLGDFITPFNRETLLLGLKLLMELDITHLLGDITTPSLIIHGENDPVCPPQAAEFLGKRLKNSKVKLIKKAGHAPFLTAAGKVNALIEDFAL